MTDLLPARSVDPVPPAARDEGEDATSRGVLAAGVVVGLMAATFGALYTVVARYGIARGLEAPDITVLRFGVAGVLTLPVLVSHLRTAPQRAAFAARWRVWLAIAALAGPPFGLLMFGAFRYAPVNHAALFPFATMSVMGTLLAARFLADRLTLRKVVGIAIVVAGLVLLSGFDAASLSGRALTGDAMFIAAGALWAGFGIVLRHHRLPPLLATAVISLVALLTYVPGYLAFADTGRIVTAAPSLLWLEAIVQGVLAGIGSLYLYAKTVQLLGAARAAVFPALAPGLAALMAWPMLGHRPASAEALGLCVAIVGLLMTATRGRTASRNVGSL